VGGISLTATKKRVVLPLAFAALGILGMAHVAGATHPRPASGALLRVSLVPAYQQCISPNRVHGPPLASSSCSPPGQTSSAVTVGTADANGAAAHSVGYFRFAVVTSAGPPVTSALQIAAQITDVRCKAGTSACGNANAAGGADYTGELQANATIRISDHYNAPNPGGGTDPATIVDIPNPATLPCVNTSDTSVGALCDVKFSPQPVGMGIPNQDWFNGKRVVVEFGQVRVADGGSDGVVGTTPNDLFAVQGVFIP
jgi:hypothetical protein